MPSPPPDPNGPPSSAPRAPESVPADQSAPGSAAPDSAGSTGSHHPEPISDLLHCGSSSKRRVPTTGAAILKMLGNPGASPVQPRSGAVQNSDDSPTVITRGHTPSPPPTPLPVSGEVPSIAGRRLGHFELIEAIGAGGMAAVLKARDLELGRIVALKILPPEAARDSEGISRFKQEARAAAMLDHENVARVYFCGEDQGLHFIAFEFVEGENLRQLIDRLGTLPPAECVHYMIQVAAGLSHATERGVVHRDIKPSNIIITPDGRAKIVDMGLARHLDAVNGGVTHSGVTLGTFDYISPEQALDPRRADVRSDIYSLGCAFYHALTGRPPVPDGTAAKKLHAHQHIDPLDPRAINPNILDDLAAVLSGMMAKNPAERYQTPAGLIAHLKGVAERLKLSLDIVARDSAVRSVPASQALPTEPPRLRLAWAIAAAAIVIAIAAFALSPPTQSPPPLPQWASDRGIKLVDPLPGLGGNGLPTPEQPTDGVVAVRTAKGLAEALAEPNTKHVHLDSGTYDLTELTSGISYTGNELHLEGSSTQVTKVILYEGSGATTNATPSVGRLTIQAAKLKIERVRFEILPLPIQEDLQEDLFGFVAQPNQPLGLAVQSTPQVDLIDCIFTNKSSAQAEAVTVSVSSPADLKPVHVRINRCLFGYENFGSHGGIALQVAPRAIVDVDDSGFGPHGAAIQVLAPKDKTLAPPPVPTAKVKLTRSTFMLESRSVAVSALSPAEVSAGHCLFAAVGSDPASLPAVLQIGGSDGSKFSGLAKKKNVYHQVNPLAIGTGDAAMSHTFAQCRLNSLPAVDSDAVMLAQRPWARPRPLELLGGADPWHAFALERAEPGLSVVDRDVAIVGAQFHPPGTSTRLAYLDGPWPPANMPKRSSTAEPRQLVWYPQPAKDEPLPPGTYSDLSALLKVAHSGDTILIRHTGLWPLEKTIDLEKPRNSSGDFKVTFKPFDGSKPILTPDPTGLALDQTLFRLLSGEVEFDGVQFLLKPSRPRNLQTVAAVKVVGGKGCTFTNCVFTLLEEDEAKSAAVLISDPDTIMVMEAPTRMTPEVKFDRCIIRGKGRGVWVPVSRAVRVEVSHSLSAIDGPFYLGEAAGETNSSTRSSFKLLHVTAFIGGPLVRLRGGEKARGMGMSGLVQMPTEVSSSLLAGVPGAGQPLVELDGIDATETTTLLPWRVQPGNRYANFDASAAMMIVRPVGEGNLPKEWNLDRWLPFAGEPAGTPIGTATFEKGPTSLRDLPSLKPADTTVKEMIFPELPESKPGDTGVDPKVLPDPWDYD